MKVFLLFLVTFILILIIFPEPKDAMICRFGLGFYDWKNRVCFNVTENFCHNYLEGQFAGCSCTNNRILMIRSCADECRANCKTESYKKKIQYYKNMLELNY